ncbi:MAG: alpha-glucan family phosphorylase [Bacteroidales bacterium]|nr:alpha-glucan family phosphorylase [Bacteroidales bacterium]MBN2755599.1 alpha-glucan family phosphorylase [Bacteroidales bacterium]
MNTPDYIFETSWEVCNKVGGIYTVVSTKAKTLTDVFKDSLILIGPDLYRDLEKNPEFEPDEKLYENWQRAAKIDGLKIKVGRWKIVGKPIVVLVDFTPFIANKNEILRTFWENYKLDSLSGHWDYIEPAIFGYAAAKVIESFYNFKLTEKQKVIAHFHEWMTGSGILYLKDNKPNISTVFTTHATAIGRSIAGNHLPLYKDLKLYDGDIKAKEFNIVSKQSLEKISAHQADCFTTVSDITAEECKQFHEKEVDVVTPNGFEDDFVPKNKDFDKKRKQARKKLTQVAETLFGYKLSENVKFLATSGRYEFSNKGLDVFVDALGRSNLSASLQETVAFILVPAHNYGTRKDLLNAINQNISMENNANNIFTHYLHDEDYDPVLIKIKENDLSNKFTDKMKVIFVPVYLNGDDGIFNLNYSDLLIGMDFSVFASYYEPWGYTPLESLAFYVPTITTNLSGFGKWILEKDIALSDCLKVIDRTDENYYYVVEDIAKIIIECSNKTEEEFIKIRQNAFEVSRIALWKNLIQYYYKAYDIAISNNEENFISKPVQTKSKYEMATVSFKSNKPIWRSYSVKTNLNQKYKKLEIISKNLWWSWNYNAKKLFEYINPELWITSEKNPITLLNNVEYSRLKELETDVQFENLYNQVVADFETYLKREPQKNKASIAYFSMEFGISNTLKIFSGGLGILAGDYLKEASDSNVDMIGVGLFYKFGYFKQILTSKGEQQVDYCEANIGNIPAALIKDEKGNPVYIEIAFPGRVVKVQVWKVEVGKIILYLLDSDRFDNHKEDRKLTHYLYGGDNNYRLQQEIILGIGGVRMLKKLSIKKDIYHLNEGHAAFAGIERINQLMNYNNLSFQVSVEIVRASSLFTTHTPVPAGHDSFPEDMIMLYMGHYPERLKITWEEFIDLGRLKEGKKKENFSMSYLAARLSQEINGVSRLHGEVTKDMFNKLWDGYFPEESHIGYVTNGVHLPSWISENWSEFYKNKLNVNLIENQSDTNVWKQILNIDDKDIWEIREKEKKVLFNYLKNYIKEQGYKQYENPKQLSIIKESVNENYLTIGFARRFATYKRGDLLFADIERLKKLVNNKKTPIRIIFAGKAHPNDGAGQDIIKGIIAISKEEDFLGKIIFLENYDIELAKKLVQGVDIWLNTPTRPLEASGTSGMKAVMNGVLNFSVLDGWWVEGYKENAGWALAQERTYENQDFQNQLDVETIYYKLENEIIPMFYDRDENNISKAWISFIKKCIVEIAPEFTTKRMLDDYYDRFYNKLYTKQAEINKNDFQLAKDIAVWKKKVKLNWELLNVVSVDFSGYTQNRLEPDKDYNCKVVLDLRNIEDIEVGVEMLITQQTEIEHNKIESVYELKIVSFKKGYAEYQVSFMPLKPGNFNYGFRIFPKNENLSYRQDIPYLKWV